MVSLIAMAMSCVMTTTRIIDVERLLYSHRDQESGNS